MGHKPACVFSTTPALRATPPEEGNYPKAFRRDVVSAASASTRLIADRAAARRAVLSCEALTLLQALSQPMERWRSGKPHCGEGERPRPAGSSSYQRRISLLLRSPRQPRKEMGKVHSNSNSNFGGVRAAWRVR